MGRNESLIKNHVCIWWLLIDCWWMKQVKKMHTDGSIGQRISISFVWQSRRLLIFPARNLFSAHPIHPVVIPSVNTDLYSFNQYLQIELFGCHCCNWLIHPYCISIAWSARNYYLRFISQCIFLFLSVTLSFLVQYRNWFFKSDIVHALNIRSAVSGSGKKDAMFCKERKLRGSWTSFHVVECSKYLVLGVFHCWRPIWKLHRREKGIALLEISRELPISHLLVFFFESLKLSCVENRCQNQQ